MIKTLIAATLAAGLLVPGIASAHTTRAELRHDRNVIHREHHQMVRAVRNDHPQAARKNHRQLVAARHEYREDLRDWHRTHRSR